MAIWYRGTYLNANMQALGGGVEWGRGAGGDRKKGIFLCTRIERKIPGLMCCFGVDVKLQSQYVRVWEDSMFHALECFGEIQVPMCKEEEIPEPTSWGRGDGVDKF